MSMTRYIGRRVIEIVITAFVLITILFFLFRVMPGDPVSMMLSPQMRPEIKAQLRVQYGFDKPLVVQYFLYMKNVLKGNFGESFYYREPVMGIVWDKLPNTLLLFGSATILSYALGITQGKIIAWKRGSKTEYVATVAGLAFYNMPIFWIGIIVLYIFAYKLDLFPMGGMITPELWMNADVTTIQKALDILYHLTLPLITLTLLLFASSMLIMRNSMLEPLRQDYITTAEAKGLPEKVVRNRHAARNAMLPVATSFSLSLAFSLAGGVLTERIFSWPGLGWELVNATVNYDYPLAQAALLFLGIVILVMMLVADIILVFLDPRIRY